MNTKKNLSIVASFAILAVTSVSAQTTTINWASPTTGGLWADANWEGGTRPTSSTQIANLGNATADRVVVAPNGGTNMGIGGLLAGIQFSQTSPYRNTVELRRGVGITNEIVLEATGGGSVVLFSNTTTDNLTDATGNYGGNTRALSAAGGIRLNTGGALLLAKTVNGTGAGSGPIIETQLLFNADTTIAGGELVVQNAQKTGSGNATRVTYTDQGSGKGNITMSSGKIEVGAAYTGSLAGTAISDTNLKLAGSLTLTGGTTLLHLTSTTHAAKLISGLALTFGGDLVLDVAPGALADGAVFKLFEATTGGLTGDFASVTLSGIGQAFQNDGSGLWTTDYNGFNYAFSESTGNLSITTSQIPEPSTVALLAGIGALMLVIGLRRLKR
ncbi:MAG: PEP-CTERM sorting domain-containing protein [Opitutaceae bacterium]|jgi:hypothetical protein|nr:PEP-CTERM sorting domain-containing protein [Opitutaceae bacterium]